jgi:uncharacterized damage-inducible protein DinB
MTADLTTLTRMALISELEHYHEEVRKLAEPLTEGQLWRRPIDPGNSIGHLILHLTGNLNHFVGGMLGGTGYVRDREREFTETDLPSKEELLSKLDEAVATFRRVVGGLSAEQFAEPHPEERFGPVLRALVQLIAHFALHRGQMTYLRRMVQPDT